MGPRAGLDRCGKSRPPPRFDPRTVQPVASRYTVYANRPTIEGLKDPILIPPSVALASEFRKTNLLFIFVLGNCSIDQMSCGISYMCAKHMGIFNFFKI